jgi:manganese/zinc/iron transport system permease protein
MMILASVLGAASCLSGSLVSAAIPDLPSGATIVLAAATLFFLSLMLGPQRGVIFRLLHHRAMRRKTDRQHVLRGLYEIIEASRHDTPRVDFERVDSARVDDPLRVSTSDLLGTRSWSRQRLAKELRRCQADGLINRHRDEIRLTDRGWQAAKRATREHRLWELYLITHADVAPGRVDHDAERIEHVLEPAMIAELEQLLPASQMSLLVPDCPHSFGLGADSESSDRSAAEPSRTGVKR